MAFKYSSLGGKHSKGSQTPSTEATLSGDELNAMLVQMRAEAAGILPTRETSEEKRGPAQAGSVEEEEEEEEEEDDDDDDDQESIPELDTDQWRVMQRLEYRDPREYRLGYRIVSGMLLITNMSTGLPLAAITVMKGQPHSEAQADRLILLLSIGFDMIGAALNHLAQTRPYVFDEHRWAQKVREYVSIANKSSRSFAFILTSFASILTDLIMQAKPEDEVDVSIDAFWALFSVVSLATGCQFVFSKEVYCDPNSQCVKRFQWIFDKLSMFSTLTAVILSSEMFLQKMDIGFTAPQHDITEFAIRCGIGLGGTIIAGCLSSDNKQYGSFDLVLDMCSLAANLATQAAVILLVSEGHEWQPADLYALFFMKFAMLALAWYGPWSTPNPVTAQDHWDSALAEFGVSQHEDEDPLGDNPPVYLELRESSRHNRNGEKPKSSGHEADVVPYGTLSASAGLWRGSYQQSSGLPETSTHVSEAAAATVRQQRKELEKGEPTRATRYGAAYLSGGSGP